MKWHQISDWLKQQYAKTSLPILLVGILTFCVAIANYRLQTIADRPKLATVGAFLTSNKPTSYIGVAWRNNGKKPFKGGTASLFVEDQTVQKKLGEARIRPQNGTSVFPGEHGEAQITFSFESGRFPTSFLICASYFGDNDDIYRQAFLYHLAAIVTTEQVLTTPLDEHGSPEHSKVCP